jgi:hypothetical protein
VQVPEHVAGGQRGDQHFFRIVARSIPHVVRIGGAQDRSLPRAHNFVIPGVRVVSGRPFTLVARPRKNGRISVLSCTVDCLSLLPGESKCLTKTHFISL